MKKAYKVLDGEPGGEKQIGRPRHKWSKVKINPEIMR
jgi:hypothetical protein